MAPVQQDDNMSLLTQISQASKEESSCAAVLSAKELSIVWGSDSRYWKWVSKSGLENSEALDVAELVEVCWLQIDGEYNASKLIEGIYGVYLIVEFNDNFSIDGPVTLKLTCPDGSTIEHQNDLQTEPKNATAEIKVGIFSNTAGGCENTVKFSMKGCDGTTWKTGLTVIGAVIAPAIC